MRLNCGASRKFASATLPDSVTQVVTPTVGVDGSFTVWCANVDGTLALSNVIASGAVLA